MPCLCGRFSETLINPSSLIHSRIIEIEWAVAHGRQFEPSPKRPKKNKTRKARGNSSRTSKGENTRSLHSENATAGDSSLQQEAPTTTIVPTATASTAPDDGKENLGLELVTDGLSVGSPPKRPLDEMRGDDSLETPPRHKKWKRHSVDDESGGGWEQWEPPAPAKKGKEML